MKQLYLLTWLFLLEIPVNGVRSRNDVLQTLREKPNAIVQVTDPERRMATTSALVLDALRSRDAVRRILIVTTDATSAQRYLDYFNTASPHVSVSVNRGHQSNSALLYHNVTITPVTNFVPELRRGSFELGRLSLLVIDDVSTLLESSRKVALRDKLRLSRPIKTVGYFTNVNAAQLTAIQALEAIFNGTALQEAQTEPPPQHTQSESPRDRALTLSSAEKQILNASFPHDFVTNSLGGYGFQNPDLLVRALLHPKYKASQRKQMKTSYEPLDYIGDFVLDFVVSRHILRNSSNKSKAQMHGIRAQLLCHQSCAYFAAHNDFQNYVLIDDGREKNEMLNYAQVAKNAREVEQMNGSSFLHKFFKSVAGAIYVDSGYDPDVVEHIYYGFMKGDMDRLLSR